MGLTFGSVCSGIEAASVAWLPLGWRCAFMSEIEAFPRAVLKHHYPETPLHGDFTTITAGEYEPIELLVGGTPCQSFSVAGLRGGLHDGRGNLALEFLRLLDRLRPRWVVWENVPGVFSSASHDAPDPRPPAIDLDGHDGPEDGTEVVVEDEYDADESHAFSCFLAGLSECGYGWAYRELDAQFFGLAQRRRRVFVVGYLGDWRRAAAVLFERHCLSGNPPPRREAGPPVAALTADGVGTCGADDNQGQAGHLIAAYGGGNTSGPVPVAAALAALAAHGRRQDFEVETFVAHALRAEGFDASEDGTGRGTPLVPLSTERSMAAMLGSAVRRLTPEECEALQGFPRGYTLIPHRGKPAADGPRYKALGNSMAVPCMSWIGRRIAHVEQEPRAA